MSLLSIAFRSLSCALLVLFAASCAAPPPSPSPDVERLLVQAGFKTVDARTPEQRQHLQSLQQGSIREMQQTGRHYYVYADAANNRLYVGTPKEYQAYLALRTRNGLPNPQPSNVTTSDMRDYLRQDAAMTKADADNATSPSWIFWPDFGTLGWVP